MPSWLLPYPLGAIALAANAVLVVSAIVALLTGARLALRGRRAAGILGALGAGLVAMCTLLLPVLFSAAAYTTGMMQTYVEAFIKLLQEPVFLMGWTGLAALSVASLVLHTISMWSAARGADGEERVDVEGHVDGVGPR